MPTAKVYPYIEFKDGTKVPFIPLRLKNSKTGKVLPQNVLALVDSGATTCMCSANIAAFLGALETDVTSREIKKFTAANGSNFEGYKVEFVLYAGGHESECVFYVVKDLPQGCQIVLGQQGFFSEHIVNFDLKKNKITISQS